MITNERNYKNVVASLKGHKVHLTLKSGLFYTTCDLQTIDDTTVSFHDKYGTLIVLATSEISKLEDRGMA